MKIKMELETEAEVEEDLVTRTREYLAEADAECRREFKRIVDVLAAEVAAEGSSIGETVN